MSAPWDVAARQVAAVTPQSQAAAVVERLGFGRAQMVTLFLAFGIWFVEGSQILVATVYDAEIAAELGLSSRQRASLTALIFAGLLVGSLLSGSIGDRLGRRGPLLAGYALAAVAQALIAFSSSYWQICPLRLLTGLAHGLGMPTSLALLNECSPAAFRVRAIAARTFFFGFGGLLFVLPVVMDNPWLEDLHWRIQVFLAAAPPAIWLVFASKWLVESPVWLASMGRWDEARDVLSTLQVMNGTVEDMPQTAVAPLLKASEGSFFGSLLHIFGCHKASQMLTLIVGTMTMNFLTAGHAYAFPKIAGSMHSVVPPGDQLLMQQSAGIIIAVLVFVASSAMPSRTILISAAIIGQVGLVAFVQLASVTDRASIFEFVFLLSQNAGNLAQCLGFTACYQLSVDLFQVRMRATSAAICISAGRIAAVAAPFIFEACPTWQLFYLVMVGSLFVTMLGALVYLPERAAQDETEPLCPKVP